MKRWENMGQSEHLNTDPGFMDASRGAVYDASSPANPEQKNHVFFWRFMFYALSDLAIVQIGTCSYGLRVPRCHV